jgi:hypothetical protein
MIADDTHRPPEHRARVKAALDRMAAQDATPAPTCTCATDEDACPYHGGDPTHHDTYAEHCRERTPREPVHAGGRCARCDLLARLADNVLADDATPEPPRLDAPPTDDLRALSLAATPGPWEVYQTIDAEAWVCEVGRGGFGVVSQPATGRPDYGKANAEFIAAAANHVRRALHTPPARDALSALQAARTAHEWPVETDEGLDYSRCKCGDKAPLTPGGSLDALWYSDHHDKALLAAVLATQEDTETHTFDLLEDPDGAPYPEPVQTFAREWIDHGPLGEEPRAALVAALESIVPTHREVALADAAEKLDRHAEAASAHIQGDEDIGTAMAAATYAHAARIVRGTNKATS